MPKVMGNVVSVISGTNKVVGRSDVDWSHIRPGSYFRVINDPHIYEIHKTNQIISSFGFQTINPYQIQINANLEALLMPDDIIFLLYHEYELFTILKIIDGGKGYHEDDILSVEDGMLSIDLQSHSVEKTQLRVATVDDSGAILAFALHKRGRYSAKPNRSCRLTGGHGQNAAAELEFIICENRQKIERVVQSVIYYPNIKSTLIHLDYVIPTIKEGILSINKWEMILTTTYLSQTAKNMVCDIITDFTNYLNLPLMLSHSASQHIIYNKSMVKLDQEIKQLHDKIKFLEDRLATLH